MAQLNVSQAARTASVSRKTIQTHIKIGKLSVARTDGEKKWIDVAELERVYGNLVAPDAPLPSVNTSYSNAQEVAPVFELKIKSLEDEVTRLREQLQHERDMTRTTMEDLRADRNEWREQAKKQTLLLTVAQEQAQSPVSFWQRLVGRKTA